MQQTHLISLENIFDNSILTANFRDIEFNCWALTFLRTLFYSLHPIVQAVIYQFVIFFYFNKSTNIIIKKKKICGNLQGSNLGPLHPNRTLTTYTTAPFLKMLLKRIINDVNEVNEVNIIFQHSTTHMYAIIHMSVYIHSYPPFLTHIK